VSLRGERSGAALGANPALSSAVSPRDLLTLRVHGLPIQMATTALSTVLRDDRAVSAIDLVEVGTGDRKVNVVDVLVTSAEATRVREKLLNSFAALYVQELREAPSEPASRRTRIRARYEWPGASTDES
jgi:hypothetical protein